MTGLPTISVIDSGNRDESLELVANVDLASDIHRGISGLVLVCGLCLGAEGGFCARQKGLCIIVPVEPLLRLKDADSQCVIEFNDIIWLVDDLEVFS